MRTRRRRQQGMDSFIQPPPTHPTHATHTHPPTPTERASQMSVATDVIEAGGLATFNLEHGFPESVVRGFRSGFLTDYDYHHLTQVRVGWVNG